MRGPVDLVRYRAFVSYRAATVREWFMPSPAKSRIQSAVWLCLAALAGSALLAAQAGPGNSPGNTYIDARICAGCHSQIAQHHLQTGMGRSFFRPTPANTVEDYTRNNEFYHPLSDTHYAMMGRDGAY